MLIQLRKRFQHLQIFLWKLEDREAAGCKQDLSRQNYWIVLLEIIMIET